eukprot:tig00000475_g1240.t1
MIRLAGHVRCEVSAGIVDLASCACELLDAEAACGGPEGAAAELKDELGLHIMALFLLVAISLVGVIYPVSAHFWPSLAVPAFYTGLVQIFGAGIVLSASLVHVLPPAFRMLSDTCLGPTLSSDYPTLGGLLALASMMLLQLFSFVFGRSCRHGHLHRCSAEHHRHHARRAHHHADPYAPSHHPHHGPPPANRDAPAAPVPRDVLEAVPPDFAGGDGGGELEARPSSGAGSGSSLQANAPGPPAARARTSISTSSLSRGDEESAGPGPGTAEAAPVANRAAPAPARRGRSHSFSVLVEEAAGRAHCVLGPHRGEEDHAGGLHVGLGPREAAAGHRAALHERRQALFFLLSSVLLYSAVIGIALGVERGPRFVALLVALCFHQLSEGIAVSTAVLAAGYTTPGPLAAIAVAPFPLSIGAGMAAGIGLRTRWKGEQSEERTLVLGVLLAVSGGILLFTAGAPRGRSEK